MKSLYDDIKNINIMAYVIDQCNFSCWYCYNRQPRTFNRLDLNQLYQFINTLSMKHNITLTIIGGEPTLHPDLYDFCKKIVCNKSIKFINIFSNFSQNILYYIELLNLSDTVNITFSYHSQYSLQFIKKFLMLIKYNVNLNQIYLSIVIEANQNFQSIMANMNLFMQYIPIMNIDMISLELKDKNYCYNNQQIKIIYDQIHKFKFRKQQYSLIQNDNTEYIACADELDFGLYEQITNKWLCNAGKTELYCHSDGKLYKCQIAYIYDCPSIGSIYDLDSIVWSPMICEFKTCGNYNISRKRYE